MKETKRLLALILSVMLLMAAVCSVPFTANAKEAEVAEIGANFINLYNEKILAETVKLDTEYIASLPNGSSEENCYYATFYTTEAGYYKLWAKNENMPTDDRVANIGIVDGSETLNYSFGFVTGEESSIFVKLEANTRYYVKLYNLYDDVNNGGFVTFSLNFFADAEPDEQSNLIKANVGEFYEGSIDVPEDVDWIFVSTNSQKSYSLTLENRNEAETLGFKADVYDTEGNLVDSVTLNEGSSITIDMKRPDNVVSYFICVSGVNTNVLGNYAVKLEEIKPVSAEVPLNEEYYDSITKPGAEGSVDYLKFTTIDKDAYYTISVKNINIVTHTWSADVEVQADILNANDEKISNIFLTEGQEKSTTLKLAPNTTYYIKVYNNYLGDNAGGNYKVNITYVLDPEKNDTSSCDECKLEEKYFGNIAARGDSDWFKITTNENTDYTFTLKNINIPTHSWSNDLKFRGVLYNDKSEELATIILGSGGESSERITLDANTTYYIAIWDPEGTTGEYSFDLSVTVIIDEEAVGMANAIEIPYDEDYYDSITGWDEENSVDYLKFTTLAEPAYYTLTAKNINIATHSWSSDYQVQVKIWNEYKEELLKLTLGEGAESSQTFRFEEDTTYYIRINNNENAGGNYKVKLTYVLDPESNDMESGNTLKIGERYYGNIAARGDNDYFTVTTGEQTEYTLLLKNVSIPTHSWSSDLQFRAVLYNKYSEELGKVLATGGNEASVTLNLEPNTTYYIKVWDPEGTSGTYNVVLAEQMLFGDTNLDGVVNIKDATLIQKYIAKLADIEGMQNILADVTEDGKINIKDATAIQKYVAKVETPYRVGELILVEQTDADESAE